MLGSTVGNYRITGELGRGGMGIVYLAEHAVIDRPAAVKVLIAKYCQDQTMLQRFINEARAAASIQHPGIVEVYDFGHCNDGSAYLIMEYLPGESLKQRLNRLGRLPVDQALQLARDTADILCAAHAANVVHRDLKPGNIMLVPQPGQHGAEQVRLMDFGIAKLVTDQQNRLTRTGTMLGSPAYMAPEQCSGAKHVDWRADLYSLGCVLFHMLCGRPPFLGNSITVIGGHIFEAPPRPSVFAPWVPGGVENVVLWLLAKKPEQRLSDARAVIAAIDSLGSSRADHASANPAFANPVGAADAATILALSSRPMPSSPDPTELEVQSGSVDTTPDIVSAASPEQNRAQSHRQGWRGMFYVAVAAAAITAVIITALVHSMGAPDANRSPDHPENTELGQVQPVQARPLPAAERTPALSPEDHPPASPPEPAKIAITIRSNPDGAAVYREVGDVRLGHTPYQHTMPPIAGELILVLRLDGHRDKIVAVPADKNSSILVELAAKKRRPTRARRSQPARKQPHKRAHQKRPGPADNVDTDVDTLNPFSK
ncbi:MAG: protein kinase [Proteobacteria bacterium]|nr:protein kinase [Pseudomonadota bacterium]